MVKKLLNELIKYLKKGKISRIIQKNILVKTDSIYFSKLEGYFVYGMVKNAY